MSNFLRDRDAKWQSLTAQLVTAVGGEAVEDEENLEVATTFSLSNFKNHTFYEFNDKATLRNFQSLVETFTVHSLENVANKLAHLRDATLERQSHLGPIILKTLMLLARSPLDGIWERLPELMATQPRPLEQLSQTEQDTIALREHGARVVAWNQQVMENGDEEEDEWMREFKASANSDSDDFFTTDDELENDGVVHAENEEEEYVRRRRQEREARSGVGGNGGDNDDPLNSHPSAADDDVQASSASSSDRRISRISPPVSLSREPTTRARSQKIPRTYSMTAPNTLVSALSQDWKKHGFDFPYTIVDEHYVVREALAALLGNPGDLLQWHSATKQEEQGDRFVLRQHICLSHLSPASLVAMIAPISETATSIHNVRKFCRVHTDPTSRMTDGGTVWQSFVAGLCDMLELYEARVTTEIQRHLDHERGQGDCTTSGLLSLRAWNSKTRTMTSMLSSIVKEAPLPPRHSKTDTGGNEEDSTSVEQKEPQRRHVRALFDLVTFKLSASLSSSLKREEEEEKKESTTLLWSLLESLTRPYSYIFGPWVDFGLLDDPHGEFFVRRTRPRQVDDHPTMGAFAVVDETNSTNNKNATNEKNDKDHGWSALFQVDSDAVPRLFRAFDADALLVGKTQYFRSKIQSLSSGTTQLPDIIASIRQERAMDEPLLTTFDRIMRPNMERLSVSSSSLMMELLTRDFDLGKHLERAREVYMLSNIDMMETFINSVFDRIGRRRDDGRSKKINNMGGGIGGIRGDDDAAVTYWLRRAMATHGSRVRSRSNGSTTTTTTTTTAEKDEELGRWTASFEVVSDLNLYGVATVGALNGLEVQYLAPWPINIVLDREALSSYNKILRWLLQVKRCKFQLDECHSNLRRVSRSVQKGRGELLYRDSNVLRRLHQCSMVISEFLHFVNNVHTYMMDRAVRTEWSHFRHDVDAASSSSMSLDDVRNRHMVLLRSITEQCLLHERSKVAKQQVVKVLNFAHRAVHAIQLYYRRATEIVEFTSERDIVDRMLESSMETIIDVHGNFKRTVRFLLVLMKSHVRNSHGASLFMSSILTTIDFSDYYSRRRR